MAIWTVGIVLIWLGFVSKSNFGVVLLLGLPFILVGLAYLTLYSFPQKKALHTTVMS